MLLTLLKNLMNTENNMKLEGKTFIYNWHNREKGRLINSLVLTKRCNQKKN